MKPRKVALVHDFLNQFGGAEKVLWQLHEMFPQAPIYTSIYIPENLPPEFKKLKIHTSFMNRIPGISRWYKHLLFLYPLVFSLWQLKGFDLVISDSSTFAKGIRVAPGTTHICYCHNPMRFAWRKKEYLAEERVSFWQRIILEVVIPFMKRWDLKTNQGVTHFIANSENVKKRIKSYYGRDSVVVHPHVEDEFLKFPQSKTQQGEYFLILSRLLGYKRIDLAVQACTTLGKNLKIVGTGKHLGYLESIAGPTVEFSGYASDEKLKKLLAGCRAVIVPGEEDFGIVPLEAMALGKPVIAYGQGGVLESVVSLKTGVFFKNQMVSDVIGAIQKFEKMKFNTQTLKDRAKQFSEERFKKQLREIIQNV